MPCPLKNIYYAAKSMDIGSGDAGSFIFIESLNWLVYVNDARNSTPE